MLFWPVAALGALGIFAGANLAFQAVLNTQLRTYLFSPLRVSLVSYAGGLACSFLGKLERLRALAVPTDVLRLCSAASIKRYRRRATTENPWELRRNPEAIRIPLLVFYCVPRRAELIDGLIELLIQITHRITVRAERRVTAEILNHFQHVRGKAGILLRIAVAALDNPDGAVRDVIFPVADEQTFENLIKEQRAGASYRQRIHTIVRSSYSSHYRRMLPKLLNVLDFRSNNAVYRPLIDALEVLEREHETGQQYFALSAVAVDGVIRPKWRELVIEEALDLNLDERLDLGAQVA